MSDRRQYWKHYMGDTPHTLNCTVCDRKFWTGFHKYSNGVCKDCNPEQNDEWEGLGVQVRFREKLIGEIFDMSDYSKRFNKELMWSSKDLEWRTPQELYDYLDGIFSFTLDPCTSEDNPLGTPKFYTPKEDGLKQSWAGEKAFLNPPYGREYPKWVKKAYEEVYEGQCVLAVLLLPARTDTKAFHDYCAKGEVWFLKGRLKFGDAKNAAPFPSMVVLFYRKHHYPKGSFVVREMGLGGDFECKHCHCKLGYVVAHITGHSLNPKTICKVCGKGQWSYIIDFEPFSDNGTEITIHG